MKKMHNLSKKILNNNYYKNKKSIQNKIKRNKLQKHPKNLLVQNNFNTKKIIKILQRKKLKKVKKITKIIKN